MDKQYGEFVGVDNLHAAIITEDTKDNYVTEAPEYLAPTAEIAGEPEINILPTYYDNVPGGSYVVEGVTNLTITVSGLPVDKVAKYLGKKYDMATGRVYDDGIPAPPEVALSFRYQKGQDDHRYYQYLKGKFSGGAEEAATITGSGVTVKTYQLKYAAVVTEHKWIVEGKEKSLKRIYADTTDPAFDPTGWFEAVQTPDTIGAPDALALVSIVPNDGVNNIAVDSEIVLTFNNQIRSEEIVIFNGDTGDVIAVDKIWNAAGKVLTLTPKSNLSVGVKYIVSITGVVDVYGQKLAASGSDFTTAS